MAAGGPTRAVRMIGIIDYSMGNLRSVQKAFELLGAEAVILPGPHALDGIDKLILPGVGAFADGMEHLAQRGWIAPIKRFIAAGKPFLGICLGMQLLFDGSEEDAPAPGRIVPGLGVLAGAVVRFRNDRPPVNGEPVLKVPHMGWNTLSFPAARARNPLFRGLADGASVYFVHSYYPRPSDPGVVAATADYAGPFCAAVWRDNVWATQFHPEKSQRVGQAMLANFRDV